MQYVQYNSGILSALSFFNYRISTTFVAQNILCFKQSSLDIDVHYYLVNLSEFIYLISIYITLLFSLL